MLSVARLAVHSPRQGVLGAVRFSHKQSASSPSAEQVAATLDAVKDRWKQARLKKDSETATILGVRSSRRVSG